MYVSNLVTRDRIFHYVWCVDVENMEVNKIQNFKNPIIKYLTFDIFRISVIFQVKSAKAVKITDASLLKRLGVLCLCTSILLLLRTFLSAPHVVVKKTADDLKAFICKTDWWDHFFTLRMC